MGASIRLVSAISNPFGVDVGGLDESEQAQYAARSTSRDSVGILDR